MTGKIIFVNGASSSGKSTLARALQASLELPFWHYSIDHFRGTGVLPTKRIDSGDFAWQDMREAFFDGFHRCLPALAEGGSNLIVEHIIETPEWKSRLVRLLASMATLHFHPTVQRPITLAPCSWVGTWSARAWSRSSNRAT